MSGQRQLVPGLFSLELRNAAVSSTGRNCVHELFPNTTAYDVGRIINDLTEVFGKTIADAGELNVLCRETWWAVCRPANESRVVYLYTGVSAV